MILFQRCWFCGDLADVKSDAIDPLTGDDIYLCKRHMGEK